MPLILLIAGLAGIAGTGAGSIAGSLMSRGNRIQSEHCMAFASGVISGLLFFSIIPESFELSGSAAMILVLAAGGVLAWALTRISERVSRGRGHPRGPAPEPHGFNEGALSLVLLVAIAIHNFPEGIVLGYGLRFDPRLGAVWAALILLHNFPIGMAISLSMIRGGASAARAVRFALLSGVTLLLGSLLSALIPAVGELFLAILFALSGGALFTIVVSEIRHHVFGNGKCLNKAAIALFLAGIAVSLAAILIE
ncbi:MAG: ZIP family metal transporter [Clostridiales Family XIII bacterium]|jgi:ZIP family zinc transporter|nr:ZIP family metal transporter [Clostridiales Family XIII bacterium]